MKCLCSGCMPCYVYIGVYQCGLRSILQMSVWGLEVCAHLIVGGVCVAEVRRGGLSCWGVVCVCDEVSAYVPETCRAKNTSIELPSCIKLAFHFISG